MAKIIVTQVFDNLKSWLKSGRNRVRAAKIKPDEIF